MVTTKKAVAPATEPVAKRVAAKSTAVKAVAKKPAAPKAVVKDVPVTPKKVAAPKKAAPAAKPAMSADQRNNYVEVAAFYIAERRGFAAANPADDWIAAEAEIDRLIASGHFTG
jgi:hypothetical protein